VNWKRSRRGVGLVLAASLMVGILAGGLGVSEAGAVVRKAAPKPSLALLVEPKGGMAPIYRLITGARSSIDLTMYELRDPIAERDLAADAVGLGSTTPPS